ncbi:glutathione S-transferase [Dyella jiangningensis]|uniref:glutathione S-transferase family protein n=1 Tax=Dyella sp. AtDHG13 TaxID=1938897 RepID=UPI000883FBA7|nr:glutathione S-transferase family protein [Dyella sp. AtDHG13]PXV59783.1 glutathione S-transferase [Dyella sp. AtDHG13]SDJ22891.1 glutathione S-transferase [Dyella jiangningensis]
MITLYQLRWSHYVEKVRWALDIKGLAWQAVDVVAYKKEEMRRFSCAQTVPLIHDASTGVAISDSSPIIRYLDETYPDRPLLPHQPTERAEAWQWMLRLDSSLGLYARRLGYTQLIMECPQVLPRLFLPDVCGGLFTRRGWRSLAAPVLGMLLIKRFRFDRNRHDRVYEQLEALLLSLADRLKRQAFIVGARLSAADITLATLLRPLRIVPYFSHHPGLQSLFAWQSRLFREYGREPALLYETLIEAQRRHCGTMRAGVGWMSRERFAPATALDEALTEAVNDQHPVNSFSLFGALPSYVKLRWFSGVRRMAYAPSPHMTHP